MVTGAEIGQSIIGRNLDILAAEQVMGWQIEEDETKLRRLNSSLRRKMPESCYGLLIILMSDTN
jgi:hypothetical protein